MDSNMEITSKVESPSATTVRYESQLNENTTKSKSLCPSDCAIVLKTVPGIKQEDYVLSLLDFVNPNTIKFASYISGGRFCIHFNNKSVVDTLVKEHSIINISGHQVSIKRLLEPAKRIIVSNVFPAIPNEAIEDALNRLGVSMVSSVQCLRAGLRDPRLSHVFSHRRQVFINPDHIDKLPSTLVIPFETRSWTVFITTEAISCFLCKANHLAATCPNSKKSKLELNLPKHINNEPINNINAQPIMPTQPSEIVNNISKDVTYTESSIKEPKMTIINLKEKFIEPQLISTSSSIKYESPPTTSNKLLEEKEIDARLFALKEHMDKRLEMMKNLQDICEINLATPPNFLQDSAFESAVAECLMDTSSKNKKNYGINRTEQLERPTDEEKGKNLQQEQEKKCKTVPKSQVSVKAKGQRSNFRKK